MDTVDKFLAYAHERRLDNWRKKVLHGEVLKKVDKIIEENLSLALLG